MKKKITIAQTTRLGRLGPFVISGCSDDSWLKRKEYRKEADDELEKTEFKIQQFAGEETRKTDEERWDEARLKEEARRREEEIRKKEAEIRRMEEEVKKKMEAGKRQKDEVIWKTEEFSRKPSKGRCN